MKLNNLKAEYLKARKEKDVMRIALFQRLLGNVQTTVKSKTAQGRSEDEILIAETKSAIEGITFTIGCCTDLPERVEDVKRLRKEYDIMQAFLETIQPKQLTDDELTKIIVDMDTKNIGFIMKSLKSNYGGRYDGKLANTIIKSL